jgi:hypothetical protein
MYDTTNTRFNYYLKTKACMDDFETFESRFALITKQRANIYLSIDIWLDQKSLNIQCTGSCLRLTYNNAER